jgi:NAD(P)-dependent dehydrogenase (short-subunit alcohol dehydrogenase family)
MGTPKFKASGWTAADIPSQLGRTAIVTGANSGLGFYTALELGRAGASVTLAVRTLAKGEEAKAKMLALAPEADLTIAELDVASLASVKKFAADWQKKNKNGLDLLINNAGVMAIPKRTTVDGFEMQFGTNHLGHFALTGQLLPALAKRPGSRVVNVSSTAHRAGTMDWDDLMGEKSYSPWRRYGQSKLANLLFTSELNSRLAAAGLDVTAMTAHPGYAATNLASVAPDMKGTRAEGLERRLMDWGARTIAQPAEWGALPTLYAATVVDLPGDSFIGPDGFGGQTGYPKIAQRTKKAQSGEDARHLWSVSEQLTNVTYEFAGSPRK